MKVQYPARLDSETKCPNCNSSITSIGGTLYACQKGHVIECVVLVTLNKQTESKTAKPKIGPVTNSDRMVS